MRHLFNILKRQGNLVSGLLNNFDIARETLDTALNKSSGSALQELENWNKGTEASISRFKSQFQALSTTTINSDMFKGFVDGGTKALEILTKIIDIGNGLPAIASILSGFMSFKGVGKHNNIVVIMPSLIRLYNNAIQLT